MTGAQVRLLRVGPDVTVQDGGRPGHAVHGVPRSGPMDWLHHRLAARLAGVAPGDVPGCAALEVGVGGCVLESTEPTRVSVAGPDVRWSVGDARGQGVAVLHLAAGDVLEVAPGPLAAWCYVVVGGGVTTPTVLGSRAMHPRSGLGGVLAPGTTLPYRAATGATATGSRSWTWRPAAALDLLPGPQLHRFDDHTQASLISATWRTTTAMDRMGQRLDGPPLRAVGGHDVVSDAVVEGSLQVPGDGRPYVLTADHQTTGGYVKPAVLTRAALASFVQHRPGHDITFRWSDGSSARQATAALLERVESCVAAPARPTAATLADANLIGGVSDAGTVAPPS